MDREGMVEIVKGVMSCSPYGGGTPYTGKAGDESHILTIYRDMGTHTAEWSAQYNGEHVVNSDDAEELTDRIIECVTEEIADDSQAVLTLSVLFEGLRRLHR